jgi:hypothetical protein
MMRKYFQFLLPLFLFFCLLSGLQTAFATSQLTMMTALNFSRFAITDNNAQHNFTIALDGSVSHDPAFVLSGDAPTAGEILLESLPPGQEITVTFGDGTLRLDGGPPEPHFVITNFTTDQPLPDNYTADGGGNLIILYGATLRTNGTGAPYPSGAYIGSHSIIIDF